VLPPETSTLAFPPGILTEVDPSLSIGICLPLTVIFGLIVGAGDAKLWAPEFVEFTSGTADFEPFSTDWPAAMDANPSATIPAGKAHFRAFLMSVKLTFFISKPSLVGVERRMHFRVHPAGSTMSQLSALQP